MILIYETDTLPTFVKDMHEAGEDGLGVETTGEHGALIRKFTLTDTDRCAYEEVSDVETVYLVYRRKRGTE